ncbi:MAG TPA: DUF998 domain-containing protein [Anaerolineales bacterium]|nr:DUF998 domain-containing protein [Anaerolineales bacterium]
MKQLKSEKTKLLLTGSVLAGPIYIIVGIAQILTREGFDITRHPLSMMSLGNLGWIQIANFIITGLLVITGAIGMGRLARAGKCSRWGALLVGIYGLGVLGGGIFVTDPALGFPPGTPNTYPQTMSWHGLLHFISGQVGFLALIAASFVFARFFAKNGLRGWAMFSALTGALFLFAIMSTIATAGSDGSIWALLALYAAVILAWIWLSTLSYYMRSEVAG